jgi:hypothetical protein
LRPVGAAACRPESDAWRLAQIDANDLVEALLAVADRRQQTGDFSRA